MADNYGVTFAQKLIQQGNYEEAILAANKHLVQDPASPEPYHDRARALAGLGRFEEAVADYAQPGEVDSLGLVSPEFQILSETSATDITNALDARIYLLWQGGLDASPDQLRIDVMRDADLAADVDALIDR